MASEPVERYAAEAADARIRIADTIDAIQDKLNPRRLMNEAVGKVQGEGEKFLGQARDTARAHPLALGAAAAAVGLALLARNRLSKARVDLGDGLGDYTDYDDGFGYQEREPARAFGNGDNDAVPPRGRARGVARRAAGSIESNPLVSIVVGLAAGAALGALFPATETERRAFAATGRMSNAARDTFGD